MVINNSIIFCYMLLIAHICSVLLIVTSRSYTKREEVKRVLIKNLPKWHLKTMLILYLI